MTDLIEYIGGDMEAISEQAEMHWDILHYKVPGGWIVYRDIKIFPNHKTAPHKMDVLESFHSTATFVPDPDHIWLTEKEDGR